MINNTCADSSFRNALILINAIYVEWTKRNFNLPVNLLTNPPRNGFAIGTFTISTMIRFEFKKSSLSGILTEIKSGKRFCLSNGNKFIYFDGLNASSVTKLTYSTNSYRCEFSRVHFGCFRLCGWPDRLSPV